MWGEPPARAAGTTSGGGHWWGIQWGIGRWAELNNPPDSPVNSPHTVGNSVGRAAAAPSTMVPLRRPAETGECDGAARRAPLPALTGCPACARDGASYAKNRTSKSRREVPQPVIGASRALLVPAVVLAFAPFGAGPKPPLPPPPRARVGRVPPRPTPFLRQAARAYTVDRSPPS